MSEISVLNGYKIKDKKAKRFYDNIESIKADTTLKSGMLVETKGYYEPHDGGAGTYEIINDDTLVEDNGLFHKLSNGLYLKLIIKDNIITPELFGAYGDNLHDDSISIQKAFDSGKNILLSKTYKCEKTINITNSASLTINGNYYNKCGLRFVNNAFLNIGSDSNVNELRLNNFSIMGDRTQEKVVAINYVTNVMLNQIHIAEGGEYLLELNHADIVFIDKCTFAGSNKLGIWQPCKGIKMTSATPVFISNCNIWNLTQFIDVKSLTRAITITNNWIEYVNVLINADTIILQNTNLIVENNSIVYSVHGENTDFTKSRIINLKDIINGFDLLVSVSKNNIIYYTTNPTEGLVEINNVPSTVNVYIEDNNMFTRLSQMNAYALIVSNSVDTRLIYKSNTNADTNNGCATSGVLLENNTHRILNPKNINISSSDTIPTNQMTDGQIWYDGWLYVKNNSNVRSIPISQSETISDLPTTATNEDIVAKMNSLFAILRRSRIISNG